MAPIFDKDEKLRQFLEGTASQEVIEEVREWAASDPGHQAQLEEFESLWERAARSAVYREIDSHADWQKVQQRLQASDTAPSGGSSTSSTARRRRTWTLAASILLLALLSVFFLRDSSGPGMNVFETDVSAQTVALSDGSKVTLRPHSRLRYPEKFAGEQRRLELEAGAAFFDVKPDPAKPFIVGAGPSLVEVKGTSFTVSRQRESTTVSVKTGKVHFYLPATNSGVVLTPGMQAVLGSQGSPATSLNSENEFSWATGRLKFEQTPVKRVLDDLAAHFQVEIEGLELLDSSKTLTTEFVNQNLEDVMQELEVVLGIRYRIENDKVFVK